MNLILRQMRWYQQGKDSVATGTADPALKKKLTETEKNLNSILNKWTWDGAKPKTATEFLNKFSPWVDEHIKQGKDLKVFLSKWGSANLTQLETTWNNTEKDYQEQIKELQNKGATELSEELKEKLENYEELETENQQLLQKIEELKKTKGNLTEEQKEKLAQYDNLETDLDQAKRDKYTIEQDNIATNNRLKLKQQEINEKDKDLARIKKEASEKNQSLNEKIKEWKTKYQKKSQLLDQEQTESNKLHDKIEELERKIASLEAERVELLKNQKDI